MLPETNSETDTFIPCLISSNAVIPNTCTYNHVTSISLRKRLAAQSPLSKLAAIFRMTLFSYKYTQIYHIPRNNKGLHFKANFTGLQIGHC